MMIPESRNLYDPIVYILKRLNKETIGSGSKDNSGNSDSCCTCLDVDVDHLTPEWKRNRITKLTGIKDGKILYEVMFQYGKNRLIEKITSICATGYKEIVTFEYQRYKIINIHVESNGVNSKLDVMSKNHARERSINTIHMIDA
ncbi:hypothetical protein [Bacillus chungangensis]|uniref:Uncharacterized protein n=1 Tax=Bacillus chungangensis TaxID=587633 RepID=A0ABT9WV14_9BACI|nr:hypothetical protein [Bacillus chungangensis]MDQ0176732.1 hypothetical protein [Bacillus chungangensis]